MVRYYREFLSSSMIRFVLLVAAASLLYTVWSFEGMRTVLAFLGGAVFFALAEYVSHRFVLHEFPNLFPALYRGHAKHHEHPEDFKHLFSPMRYDLLLYIGYTAVLWALFRDAALIAAIVAGTSVYQLYYQWMHYVAHRPITPVTPWGRWMKKKHLLHHFMDEHSWYGVSHPALDYALGTDKPAPGAPVRRNRSRSAGFNA